MSFKRHYVKNVKIHQCDFINYKINIINNIIDLCYNTPRITNVKNNVKIMFTIYTIIVMCAEINKLD